MGPILPDKRVRKRLRYGIQFHMLLDVEPGSSGFWAPDPGAVRLMYGSPVHLGERTWGNLAEVPGSLSP
jgi:hypothetical protein